MSVQQNVKNYHYIVSLGLQGHLLWRLHLTEWLMVMKTSGMYYTHTDSNLETYSSN